ncbi:MAG: hypothetical protein J6N72_08905 [Psychrobacter sp.]|nr:hypothetical protein [Psychrobacter sp.]
MEKTIAVEKLEKFLNENGSGITLELGSALVDFFGGASEFVKAYKSFDKDAMNGGRGDDSYDLDNIMFWRDNKAELSSLMLEMAESASYDSAILMIHTEIKDDLGEELNLDKIGRIYFNLDYDAADSDMLIIIDWVIWKAAQQLCLAFDAEYNSIDIYN